MINVSEKAATIINGFSRTFYVRFLLNGKQISGDVRSMTLYKGTCGDSQFVPGAVFASYVDITVDYCTELLDGCELKCQIGVLVDENVEWYDVGMFTVQTPSNDAYTTSFTALGRIGAKMGGLYVSKLSYPATIQNVIDEISTQTGVNITAPGLDTSGLIKLKPEGFTHREMLAFIAGIFFGYATEDNSGNVVLGIYSTENNLVETNGDRTTSLPTFTDFDTEITGIKVVTGKSEEEGKSEEDETETAFVKGTIKLAVSNQFMTQELFDANVDNLIGFTYRPGTVHISMGDFRIEPFDCVKVTDVLGNIRYVPCMSVVHTFDGGIITEIVAPGISNEEGSTSAFKGPVVQMLDRYKAELFTVEKLVAKTASVEYLEANLAKIDTAVIGELFAHSGVITELKMVDGYVTGKLNGVEINADVITTGTLAVDRLLVTGKDSVVYQINVESSGLSVEELQEEVYQKYLNGTDIVANSITATQIAASTITSQEINVEELFASEITASKMHIIGESTFSGALKGATGSFTGIVEASSLKAKRGYYICDTDFNKYYQVIAYIGDHSTDSKYRFGRLTANEFGSGLNYIEFEDSSQDRYCNVVADVFQAPETYVTGNIDADGHIYTDKALYFGMAGANVTYGIRTPWKDGDNRYIVERDANGLTCRFGWEGSSSYSTTLLLRGQTIKYTTASGNVTLSDERLKKDFDNLDRWESFYNSLYPYAFKLKNGNGDRYHIGFKAQQVVEALLNNGLSDKDFAGYVKSKYYKDPEGDPKTIEAYEDAGISDGDDEYGLIYTEFIALNTHMIQKLMGRVKKLESQISGMEVVET